MHVNQRAGRARARSTARCSRACSRTSACATRARARVPRARAARASRSSPARRSRAEQPDVGDGRRARRDVAAVGPHRRADRAGVGRAAAEHLVCAHLLRAALGAPRGAVVATERVTLYGLPIVAGRTVAYGRIDPALVARAVHPPRAGRGRLGHAPRVRRPTTRARLEEVEALEDRARRRDLLVDDEVLFAFFDARVPADVVSGAHFDRWWRDARRARPGAADLPARAAGRRERGGRAGPRSAPGRVERRATSRCALSYRFEPGRAARRRHRPRAAGRARRSCAQTASTGSSRRCGSSSSPR